MKAPLELPEGLLTALRTQYATPPRAYHSFAHVEEVLRFFAEVAAGPGWQRPREVYLAMLFHDAVYLPGQKDNEEQSAMLARREVERWLTGEPLALDRVGELVRLTARHGSLTPGEVDPEAALFLDCDMAILGAPPAGFDAYDAAIREEYSAVPSVLYALGRRKFLTRLLKTPRIFLSDFFHQRLDGPARANLRRALG